MSILKNIGPRFEKTAMMTKLSEDTERWVHEITDQVYQQIPSLSGKDIEVNLQKVNNENKSAIGVVKVASGGKSAVFPIIVKKAELFPLDTVIINGKPQPATSQELGQYYFNPSLFTAVEPKKDYKGTAMDSSVFPFNLSNRSMGGQQSVSLTKSAETVNNKELDAAKERIKNDPYLSKYLNLDNFKSGELKKTASTSPPPNKELDAMVVYKNFEGDTEAIGLVRDPFSIYKFKNDALEKNASEILKKEERILVGRSEGSVPESKEVKTGIIKTASLGKGLYFDSVIDLDGKPVSKKLFIGKEAYAYQEKVAGTQIGGEKKINRNDPLKGRGIFYYQDGPEKIATYPVLVGGKVEDKYSVTTPVGITVKLGFSDNIRHPVRTEDNTYLLPGSAKFVSLPPKDDGIPYLGDLEKEKNRVEINKLASDRFMIEGIPLGGADLGEIPKDPLVLTLLGLGATREEAEKIEKTAAEQGKAEFWAPSSFKIQEEDNTEKEEKEKLDKLASLLKKDLFVEAATLNKNKDIFEKVGADGGEVVDKLLSLNFISGDNIISFVNELPDLKKTAGTLSGLLLASRLGMSTIPEQPVQNSIRNLVQVVQGLESLKSGYQFNM